MSHEDHDEKIAAVIGNVPSGRRFAAEVPRQHRGRVRAQGRSRARRASVWRSRRVAAGMIVSAAGLLAVFLLMGVR